MKIEDTITQTIKIWDLDSYFDIILVNLSEAYPGAGRLTLTADSDSWSYYWGGIGADQSLAEFLLGTNVDYLTMKLGNGISSTMQYPDDEECVKAIHAAICRERRGDNITAEQARSAWNDIDGCENVYRRYEYDHEFEATEFLDDVKWPKPAQNPAYDRLAYAVTKMREALRQLEKKKNGEPALSN